MKPLLRALPLVFLAAGFALPSAFADGSRKRALRDIADRYAADGNLDAAEKALRQENAKPDELFQALREKDAPDVSYVPGEHSIEIEDDHKTKTDLLIEAPSAEAIKAHEKQGLALVVLLHGLGGSSSTMERLARAIADTGEAVVVCPSAQPVPKGDGGEDGAPNVVQHWWLYDDPHSFTMEAIREARSLYPIDPDRVALAGHSMGGYATWNIGLRRPDRFAALGPLAGGLSRLSVIGLSDSAQRPLLDNGGHLHVRSYHGTSDNVVPYDPDKAACDRLKDLGADVELDTLEGAGHSLGGLPFGMGKNVDGFVKFLTGEKRDPCPSEVTYVSPSERCDGAYWLRIVTREPAKDGDDDVPARVKAKIDRARNAITIEGKGVSVARVYLDDRLLDLSKPVTIEAAGTVRFQGKVKVDVKALLESWRSRQDEELVYPAYVDVDPRSYD